MEILPLDGSGPSRPEDLSSELQLWIGNRKVFCCEDVRPGLRIPLDPEVEPLGSFSEQLLTEPVQLKPINFARKLSESPSPCGPNSGLFSGQLPSGLPVTACLHDDLKLRVCGRPLPTELLLHYVCLENRREVVHRSLEVGEGTLYTSLV